MERAARTILAALLVAVFASSSAWAGDVEDCEDKWEDSDAYDYCSDATVSWWVPESDPSLSRCRVVGSCSITVSVDDVQTTFSPSLNQTKTKAAMAQLDICFHATSTVTATVRKDCGPSEVTSDTATTDGLTTTD